MSDIQTLFIKEKLFSWLDNYDVYDEYENPVYTVKGQLAWGHKFHIYDAMSGQHVATIKQELLTFLPRFTVSILDHEVGTITKELTLFKPRFEIDFMNWHVEGDLLGYNYTIYDDLGSTIAIISKAVLSWSDTYRIDVDDPNNMLASLCLVLAIDAIICDQTRS